MHFNDIDRSIKFRAEPITQLSYNIATTNHKGNAEKWRGE